jgi:hypothetical protein
MLIVFKKLWSGSGSVHLHSKRNILLKFDFPISNKPYDRFNGSKCRPKQTCNSSPLKIGKNAMASAIGMNEENMHWINLMIYGRINRSREKEKTPSESPLSSTIALLCREDDDWHLCPPLLEFSAIN